MPYLICPAIDTTLTFQWPIKKTPRFSTIEQMPASNRGPLYISLAQWNLWKFSWTLGYLPGDFTETNSTIQELVNFFMALQGRGAAFLFLDPYDNTIPSTSPQQIGTGDGTTTQFAIYRSLTTSGGAADLIQNFVNPPVIYVNGSSVLSSTYSIDAYGTLTFNTAPTSGHTVAWSGEFYFLCRFDQDQWDDLQEDMYQIWTLKSFSFSSILN